MPNQPTGQPPGNSRQRKQIRKVLKSVLSGQHNQPVPKTFAEKILGWVEQPLFINPVAGLAGIIGIFIFTPILAIVGICVMLAFHRAGVVRDWNKKQQAIAYGVLFVITTSGLYGIGILIKQRVPQLATRDEIAAMFQRARSAPIPQNSPTSANELHFTSQARKPKSIAIEIENSALMTEQRDYGNGLWVAYRSAYGDTLSPVNLAIFFRFVNLGRTSVRIDSYTVELKIGEKWIPLTRVETLGQTMYFAYPDANHPTIDAALKHAKKQDFSTNGIENELTGSNALLPVDGMIRGWGFYEYPASIDRVTGKEEIKVTVKDMNGVVSEHIHNRAEEQASKNTTLHQFFVVPAGPFEDISSFARKHWSDPIN